MGCDYNNRCSFTGCGTLAVIISIIFGIVVGLLFAIGLLPGIAIGLWIAFGLAVLSLIILVAGLYLSAADSNCSLSKCLRKNTACLLIGIFGTIITAIISLIIPLAVTIIAAIIIGIAAFFFVLLLIGLIAYLLCIKDKLYF